MNNIIVRHIKAPTINIEKNSMLLSKSSLQYSTSFFIFFFIFAFSLGLKKKRRMGSKLARMNPSTIRVLVNNIAHLGTSSPRSLVFASPVRMIKPMKKSAMPNTLIRWSVRMSFSSCSSCFLCLFIVSLFFLYV